MDLFNIMLSDVCSGAFGDGSYIPGQVANIIHIAILLIQIVVPILLIVWGMLDLGKAVMAQKEDEIKKGQQTFVKRLIAAAIVFFIVVIVKLVVGLIAGDSAGTITGCMDQIVNYKG